MKFFSGIFIFFVTIAVLLNSCTKDAEVNDTSGDFLTGYIRLDMEAMLYEDESSAITKEAAVGAQKKLNQVRETVVQTDNFGNSFYSEFSVDESIRKSGMELKDLKSALKQKVAAKEGVNMPSDTNNPKYRKVEKGVKYMVLIFDNEDNHIGTTLTEVGKEEPIPVRYKADYEFSLANYYRIVAFTFNTKDARDFDNLNLDPEQTNNTPKIVFPSDKEFYYHNSDFLLDPMKEYQTPPKVNIILLPQTVKVGITVDARGVNAKVKKVSGTFGSFAMRKTARFDLKLNKVLEKFEVSEQNFPYDFSLVGDNDSLSIARYVYMDDQDNAVEMTNFNVTLKELIIQRNGEINELSLLNSPTTKVYNFDKISLVKGKYFSGKINLLSGFNIGGIVWAFGNLYYDRADSENQFKIRNNANDGKGAFLTDYWYQNDRVFKVIDDSTTFLGITSYVYKDVVGDPCSHVYPKNTWRMPTHPEAEMLFAKNATSGLQFRYDKTNKVSRYVEYRMTGTNSPVLRFYGHGYYNSKTHLTPNLVASFLLILIQTELHLGLMIHGHLFSLFLKL